MMNAWCSWVVSLCVTCLAVCSPACAPADARGQDTGTAPTAEQLMAAMDKNLTFEARKTRTLMTVEGRRTRSYEMISYGRGEEDAAMEYVAPARDKGTRMLKLGDELWIYLPSVDRVQKISGHMMGSDVSYEDMLASRELRKRYQAKVTGSAELDKRPCWVLELKAKDDSVTYPKRITYVDKQSFIPVKQDLYALSGMLLKTWSMSDVKEFAGGRKFPTKMIVEDHVKKQSITRLEFREIEFNVQFPREVFSVRWLERH